MKVVLQDGIKDCGVCCLLSIIRYYGGNVSKEYLRDLTSTTKNGVSAYNLIKAAKILGFNAYAMHGDIEQIDANNLPVVAHIILNKSYHHFIVIYGIDFSNEKVIVMDPAKGKKTLTLSEFKLQASNNYIFLRPLKKLPLFRNKRIIVNTSINFLQHNYKCIIFIILLTVICFLYNIATAFHFKYLLEYAIQYEISNNVIIISYIMIFIYLFKNISIYLRNILLIKYSNIFDQVITTKIYKQVILLPYLYYKNRTTGEVISRFKDLATVKGFLINLITSLSTDILSVVIFIVILFNINCYLTYFCLGLFLIMLIINLSFRGGIKNKTLKYYKQEEKINTFLIESLSSVEVVKGMHIEKRITDRFIIKYKNYLKSSYSLTVINELYQLLKGITNDIFYVLILAIGTILTIKKDISFGNFIIYQNILNFYINSFKNIIHLINEFPKYKVAIERIEEIFTIKEENFIGSNYYLEQPFMGKVEYNNLTYAYNSKALLNNINFTINIADRIFLYGPSGTGKSTFVKLLMRYVEVPFGTIKIDDIDINHYHLDILRNHITYVSQQEFLFNDTIYNNISLNRKIDSTEIKKVAKLTYINEFSNIDDMIEENGFNFSGGERQRIILARSILKESNIYIFDEALSQIDVNKERKILLNIFKYLKDKTIIVISHRFDNKDLFKRIIKIENGSLNEEKL